MILPDTNILIAYFSRRESAASLVRQAISKKKVIFSIVAVAEFLTKATKKDSLVMSQLIDEIGLVGLTREIMNLAVMYRKIVLRKTKRVLLLDCFLAATAKIHNATLVTFDRHDYPFSDIAVKQPEELMLSLKK